MSRRPVLGLASDDPHLQNLIAFESTPETARFGFREFVKGTYQKRTKAGSMQSLPVSLTEMELDRLQQDGNDAFKGKKFLEAVRMYTLAIAKAGELNAPSPKKLQASRAAQLFANRCQAHLSLGDENAALADAESCVQAAPGWPKAYFRHGTCLMRRKLYAQAHEVFLKGRQLDATNEDLIKACRQAEASLAEAGAGDAGVKAGPASVPPAGPSPRGTPLPDEGSSMLRNAHLSGPSPPSEGAASSARSMPAQIPDIADRDVTGVHGSEARSTKPRESAEKVGASSETASGPRAGADGQQGGSFGSANKMAASDLPVPEHTLSTHPGGGGYLLEVKLPMVAKSSEVDLQIGPDVVELGVPNVYSTLSVPMPRQPAVDDDNATARFDTKVRVLKLFLPYVD